MQDSVKDLIHSLGEALDAARRLKPCSLIMASAEESESVLTLWRDLVGLMGLPKELRS